MSTPHTGYPETCRMFALHTGANTTKELEAILNQYESPSYSKHRHNTLIPRNPVLLEKLTVTQPVKKFPTFYRTPRFITVFNRTRHCSVSCATCIQSSPSHPISLRSILILFSHLLVGLPSGLFPSGFPTQAFYSPRRCATSAFTVRTFSPSPNAQSGVPSLVGCPRLLIHFIRSCPPSVEAISSIRNPRTRHATARHFTCPIHILRL
jgi:hypothetical protein